MKQQTIKYLVLKGTFSSGGAGDYFTEGEFTNLKDALKFFNKIKKETAGWIKEPDGYIETLIQRLHDLNDPEWMDTIDIVESHQVDFKKGGRR